jgi:hypothetical protein
MPPLEGEFPGAPPGGVPGAPPGGVSEGLISHDEMVNQILQVLGPEGIARVAQMGDDQALELIVQAAVQEGGLDPETALSVAQLVFEQILVLAEGAPAAPPSPGGAPAPSPGALPPGSGPGSLV